MRRHTIVIYLLSLVLARAATDARAQVAEAAPAQPAEQAPPRVTLMAPGAEPRTPLRLRPTVGAQQTMTMTIHMSMKQTIGPTSIPAMNLPPMQMSTRVTVERVEPNGDIAYTLRFTEANALTEPGVPEPLREQMAASLATMTGMTVRSVMNDRGIERSSDIEMPESMEPQAAAQMRNTTDSMQQFVAPLPEEAVGEGAVWRVDSEIRQGGITMRQTSTHRLVSLRDGVLGLTAEVAQEADPQNVDAELPPGITAHLSSFQGRGTGRMTQRLTDLVPTDADVSGEISQTLDLTMGDQSQRMVQQMQTRVRIQSEPVE